jgi:hypothetical protein
MSDHAHEPEELDAVPVLVEVRAVEPAIEPGALVVPVTVQAVAVGAAGIVAGVAAVAVAQRRRSGRRMRRLAGRDITATRSFLVDVHALSDRRR